ncbi:hypothetical protein ACK4PD_08335 [Proteus mirabilis]|uniref:hypothetical protein n=2 Tax=Proteus mirabilis TaxID=584 RepID=UPI001624D747|nr:hypothetical protein [Proteus mirabilis]MBB6685644.1 hypothetical protein [Proteus mirabilis]HEK2728002.1 hypothetical protein [Proteus mirabilis]HEK4022090.1 hypothetical protein [Proteus mirabilis]
MIHFIALFLSIQSIYVLIKSLSFILRKKYNAAILYYPIFFFFFPIHTILDYLIGYPNYKKDIQRLTFPMQDNDTNIIYYAFIIIINFILLYYVNKNKKIIKDRKVAFNKNIKTISTILLTLGFLGPISIFFTSTPDIYISYGNIRNYMDTPIYNEYSIVWLLTIISSFIILVIRLLYGKDITLIKSVVLISILAIDIYFNNKRLIYGTIVIYTFISFFYSKSTILNLIKIISCTIIFSSLYINYSFNHKYNYKVNNDAVYASLRHELGRDDVTKFAINKVIINDEKITEYIGQSYINIMLAWIPRAYWKSKPYPYSQYLTSKVIRNKTGPALKSWTITSSFYDEAIANFGIWGFILSIIILTFFLRNFDKSKTIVGQALPFSILILYTMTNMNWFVSLFYIYILYLIYNLLSLNIKFYKNASN